MESMSSVREHHKLVVKVKVTPISGHRELVDWIFSDINCKFCGSIWIFLIFNK